MANGAGSPKTPITHPPVDDPCMDQNKEKFSNSNLTLEPYIIEENVENTKFILHVKPVPLHWSFDVILSLIHI